MTSISISLYNTETELLKANPSDLDEKNKKVTRKLHRNQILEKFYAGQSDEKYTKDYYELLKKADKFKMEATPRKMAIAADKYTKNYGKVDEHDGLKHEHFGFFDETHKHHGKPLKDVILTEYQERKTKEDDYEILHIFNNYPIELGFKDVLEFVDENNVKDFLKSKNKFKFPIKINRNKLEVCNKIEELTEFLHVKKIGFEYRQLEFFVPNKFNTKKYENDDEIIKEIITFEEVYINGSYGELIGFKILKFMKRIDHNEMFDVFFFEAIELK
jgi:hypothetical protein